MLSLQEIGKNALYGSRQWPVPASCFQPCERIVCSLGNIWGQVRRFWNKSPLPPIQTLRSLETEGEATGRLVLVGGGRVRT